MALQLPCVDLLACLTECAPSPLLGRADAGAEHARYVLGVQLEHRPRAVRAGEQEDDGARP